MADNDNDDDKETRRAMVAVARAMVGVLQEDFKPGEYMAIIATIAGAALFMFCKQEALARDAALKAFLKEVDRAMDRAEEKYNDREI